MFELVMVKQAFKLVVSAVNNKHLLIFQVEVSINH